MLRVRMQDFRTPGKRHSVKIISVDEFTKFGRQLTSKAMTDRELVKALIDTNPNTDNLFLIRTDEGDVLFWLEGK